MAGIATTGRAKPGRVAWVRVLLLSALLLSMLGPLPAYAGYVLVPAGKPVRLTASPLEVTPNIDWNRHEERSGPKTSSWTLDGLVLNDLSFFAGIVNNTPLVNDPDKDKAPLPRFEATMLPPDIAQLFETTYRVALGTGNFNVDTIEPADFAGQKGFRFTYSFVIQGEEVRRKGEANGAVVGGRLFMITYEAPALHYFETNLPAYRAVVDSATLVGLDGPPPPERRE